MGIGSGGDVARWPTANHVRGSMAVIITRSIVRSIGGEIILARRPARPGVLQDRRHLGYSRALNLEHSPKETA